MLASCRSSGEFLNGFYKHVVDGRSDSKRGILRGGDFCTVLGNSARGLKMLWFVFILRSKRRKMM